MNVPVPPVDATSLLAPLSQGNGPAWAITAFALFVCWKLVLRVLNRADQGQDKRDKAFLDALDRLVKSTDAVAAKVQTVDDELREIRRIIESPRLPLRGG